MVYSDKSKIPVGLRVKRKVHVSPGYGSSKSGAVVVSEPYYMVGGVKVLASKATRAQKEQAIAEVQPKPSSVVSSGSKRSRKVSGGVVVSEPYYMIGGKQVFASEATRAQQERAVAETKGFAHVVTTGKGGVKEVTPLPSRYVGGAGEKVQITVKKQALVLGGPGGKPGSRVTARFPTKTVETPSLYGEPKVTMIKPAVEKLTLTEREWAGYREGGYPSDPAVGVALARAAKERGRLEYLAKEMEAHPSEATQMAYYDYLRKTEGRQAVVTGRLAATGVARREKVSFQEREYLRRVDEQMEIEKRQTRELASRVGSPGYYGENIATSTAQFGAFGTVLGLTGGPGGAAVGGASGVVVGAFTGLGESVGGVIGKRLVGVPDRYRFVPTIPESQAVTVGWGGASEVSAAQAAWAKEMTIDFGVPARRAVGPLEELRVAVGSGEFAGAVAGYGVGFAAAPKVVGALRVILKPAAQQLQVVEVKVVRKPVSALFGKGGKISELGFKFKRLAVHKAGGKVSKLDIIRFGKAKATALRMRLLGEKGIGKTVSVKLPEKIQLFKTYGSPVPGGEVSVSTPWREVLTSVPKKIGVAFESWRKPVGMVVGRQPVTVSYGVARGGLAKYHTLTAAWGKGVSRGGYFVKDVLGRAEYGYIHAVELAKKGSLVISRAETIGWGAKTGLRKTRVLTKFVLKGAGTEGGTGVSSGMSSGMTKEFMRAVQSYQQQAGLQVLPVSGVVPSVGISAATKVVAGTAPLVVFSGKPVVAGVAGVSGAPLVVSGYAVPAMAKPVPVSPAVLVSETFKMVPVSVKGVSSVTLPLVAKPSVFKGAFPAVAHAKDVRGVSGVAPRLEFMPALGVKAVPRVDIQTIPSVTTLPSVLQVKARKTIPREAEVSVPRVVQVSSLKHQVLQVPRSMQTPVVTQVSGVVSVMQAPSVLRVSVPAVQTAYIQPSLVTQLSVSATRQMRVPVPSQMFAPVPGVPKPIVPPPPPPPGFIWPTPSSSKKVGSAFRVEVRKKGKWLAVGGKMPRRMALAFGVKETRSTAARSFRLLKAGKTVARDVPFVLGLHRYRKPKRKTKLKGEEVFVEKAKFALDMPGEVQEISAKGWEALRMKSIWGKSKKKSGKKGKRKERWF